MSTYPLLSIRRSRTVVGAMLRSSTSTASVLDRLLRAAANRTADLESFLLELEQAAIDLEVEKADRGYRHSFPVNYRKVFMDGERSYNADVFRAMEDQQEDIDVNGTTYQITRCTQRYGQELRYCLGSLFELLQSWSKCSMMSRTPQVKPLLAKLDKTWAQFEKMYIAELVCIEAEARKPLVAAIALEQELFHLERGDRSSRRPQRHERRRPARRTEAPSPMHRRQGSEVSPCAGRRQCSGESPCARQRSQSGAESPCARQRFFSGEMPQIGAASKSASTTTESPTSRRCPDTLLQQLARSAASRGSRPHELLEQLLAEVAVINACANLQGRGRGDLTVDVLEAAADVLKKRPDDHSSKLCQASTAARQHLARRVLKSFVELRQYLADVEMLEVHPQLSCNGELVRRLAAWEEAWELGSWLLQPRLLQALGDVAACAADAQRFSGVLRGMLEDQDAELFLILPRMVLLCGLADPADAALPANLLPHHFGDAEKDSSDDELPQEERLSQGMRDLSRHFSEVSMRLGANGAASRSAFEILIQSAIAGPGQNAEICHDKTVEDFMLRLEGFSMELQRHKPADWNRCCEVLLQCIQDASAAQPGSER